MTTPQASDTFGNYNSTLFKISIVFLPICLLVCSLITAWLWSIINSLIDKIEKTDEKENIDIIKKKQNTLSSIAIPFYIFNFLAIIVIMYYVFVFFGVHGKPQYIIVGKNQNSNVLSRKFVLISSLIILVLNLGLSFFFFVSKIAARPIYKTRYNKLKELLINQIKTEVDEYNAANDKTNYWNTKTELKEILEQYPQFVSSYDNYNNAILYSPDIIEERINDVFEDSGYVDAYPYISGYGEIGELFTNLTFSGVFIYLLNSFSNTIIFQENDFDELIMKSHQKKIK